MYRIYYINFDYYSAEEFTSFGAALDYGKSKSFEFRIDAEDGTPLASWSPIGGFREFNARIVEETCWGCEGYGCEACQHTGIFLRTYKRKEIN